MKTYRVTYTGNCLKLKRFEEIINASNEREAVERVYAERMDYNYFPQDDGVIKDCDGDIIALPDHNSISFDGGYFVANDIYEIEQQNDFMMKL